MIIDGRTHFRFDSMRRRERRCATGKDDEVAGIVAANEALVWLQPYRRLHARLRNVRFDKPLAHGLPPTGSVNTGGSILTSGGFGVYRRD